MRWQDKFADNLRDMEFLPYKAEHLDRKSRDLSEYIAVYIDGIAFVLRDSAAFTEILINNYKYKRKRIGSISFHLGCDFIRDEKWILYMSPKKYIDKMIDGYQNMFGEKPKTKY